MPQKKKPITDWVDTPIKPEITDWEDDKRAFPEDKSLLQKWDESVVNRPLLDLITDSQGNKIIDPKAAADYYDPIAGRTQDQAKIPEWVPGIGGGTYRSLGAGMLEGAGDVVRGLTSPLNLATLGAAKGAGMLARDAIAAGEAIPWAARALKGTERVLSAPVVGSGLARIANAQNLGDVGFGVAEMAGGTAGVMDRFPKPAPPAAPVHTTTPSPQLQLELPNARGQRGPTQQYLPGMDPFAVPEPRLSVKEIYDWTDQVLGRDRSPEVATEQQQGLDFGPLRNRAGRFSQTADWEPGPLLNESTPAAEPGQQSFDFGPPEPPATTPPATSPGAGPTENVISKPNWTTEEILRLRREGYESGGVDPNTGYPRMIKRLMDETGAMFVGPRDPRITSEVPQYPPPETPPPSGEAGPPSAGAPAPKEPDLPLSGGVTGGFSDSLSNNPLRTAVEQNRAQMQAEVNAELGVEAPERGGGLEAIKKFLADESGTFDIDALKEELSKLLGRVPTLEEIQRYAFTKGTGAREGEQTGRVAPFMSLEERLHRQEDLGNLPTEELVKRMSNDDLSVALGRISDRNTMELIISEMERRGMTTTGPASDKPPLLSANFDEAAQAMNEVNDVNTLQEYLGFTDKAIEWYKNNQSEFLHEDLAEITAQKRMRKLIQDKINQLRSAETPNYPDVPYIGPQPPEFDARFPPGQIVRSKSLGQIGRIVPDDAQIRAMTLQQLTDYRQKLLNEGDRGRPELAVGRERALQEIQAEIEARNQQPEQPGLPGMGPTREMQGVPETGGIEIDPFRLANIISPERQPEQQSMVPDFQDAEISNYLRNEDAIPPEMRDLETGEAPKRRWSEELKRFIDDTSGEFNFDPEAIIRWINERFRRTQGRSPTQRELNDEIIRLRTQAGGYTYPGMRSLDIQTNEYNLQSQQGQRDIQTAVETGGPLQQQLPIGMPQFQRPPKPYNYGYDSTANALERLRNVASEVVQLTEQARALERAGNVDEARAMRERIGELRGQRDWYLGESIKKSDELLARADRETDPAKAERLRRRADALVEEEFGQLKLAFDPKKRYLDPKELGLTQEMVNRIKNDLNPHNYSSGIGRGYAHLTLNGIPDGPPGLQVRDWHYSNSADVIYRDPQGKPIGAAQIHDGETSSLVVDETKGLLQGRALVAMLKEIAKRNAGLPSGSYSPFTKHLLEEIVKFWDDSRGSVDITPILRAFQQGGVIIGRSYDAMKRKLGITPQQQGQQAEYNFVKEALTVPTAINASGDLSAPGRQGLTQVLTPEFWAAAFKMFGGLHSGTFDRMDAELRSRPLFRPGPINPRTGLPEPSFAQKIGFNLFEPASKTNVVGKRAEAVASKWLETGAFLGPKSAFGIPNPVRGAYNLTAGAYFRATNRAFITFLNQLNANRLEFLMDRAADMSTKAMTTGSAPLPGMMGGFNPSQFRFGIGKIMPDVDIGLSKQYTRQEAVELNPYLNLNLAKEIAEFTNAATGHGTAKNILERAVQRIGPALFSPKLLISRIRMINPNTYVMASPYVRKQYAKAAIGAMMGWYAFTQMSKLAAEAQGLDYEIVDDPTNSDFGKFRIGNTRLDFGGGFLQIAVLLGRMYHGGWTSSSNPEAGMHRWGESFPPETAYTNLQRFMANKLNPAYKFAYDVLNASKQQPFMIKDRTAQLFVNLFGQDLMEMYQKNPELLPWMAPVALGVGTQTYEKGGDYLNEQGGRFVDPENDWKYEGAGGLRQMMPWNWGEEDQGEEGFNPN